MAHTLRLILVIATLLEILLSTTLLAIFVYVFNNDVTTILWYDGGAQGWNSDPSLRVYEYANYRELPPVPLIWDISSTKSNIFIALVTIVIWIIRCFVNFWDACSLDLCGTLIANAAYDIKLIALWAYSSVAQSSGDFTDTQHISIRPWYLAQGCDQAHGRSRGTCEIMVAAYELSVFATFWFSIRLLATCLYRAYTFGQMYKHDPQIDIEQKGCRIGVTVDPHRLDECVWCR